MATLKGKFTAGTTVKLTAKPDDNSEFVGWTGDAVSNEEEIHVMADADKDISLIFRIKPLLSLTLTGTGTVTSSPSGIDTDADEDSAYFATGAEVILTESESNDDW